MTAASAHTHPIKETHFKEHDKSVVKVCLASAPCGHHGERYLASGKKVAMRLWENEKPAVKKPETVREYELVGYVISGRAELHLEGQVLLLEAGDSWMVPPGAHHSYKILENFTAVEATSPPHYLYGRDTDDAAHVSRGGKTCERP